MSGSWMQRGRDQDLLPHALRIRRHRRMDVVLQPEEREEAVDLVLRAAGRRCRAGRRPGTGTPARSGRYRAPPPRARSRCAPCRPAGRRESAGRRSSTVPPDGSSRPVRIDTVVDFPDPFGPSRPRMPPGRQPEAQVPNGRHRRVVLGKRARFEHGALDTVAAAVPVAAGSVARGRSPWSGFGVARDSGVEVLANGYSAGVSPSCPSGSAGPADHGPRTTDHGLQSPHVFSDSASALLAALGRDPVRSHRHLAGDRWGALAPRVAAWRRPVLQDLPRRALDLQMLLGLLLYFVFSPLTQGGARRFRRRHERSVDALLGGRARVRDDHRRCAGARRACRGPGVRRPTHCGTGASRSSSSWR